MKKNVRNILLYIAIPIILILSFVVASGIAKNTEETKYSQIVQYFEQNQIKEFTLNDYSGELTYTLRDSDKKYRFTISSVNRFYNDTDEIIIA